MKSVIDYLLNLIRPTSVDAALASLNRARERLNRVQARKTSEADGHYDAAVLAKFKEQAAREEAFRAAKVSQRLAELTS